MAYVFKRVLVESSSIYVGNITASNMVLCGTLSASLFFGTASYALMAGTASFSFSSSYAAYTPSASLSTNTQNVEITQSAYSGSYYITYVSSSEGYNQEYVDTEFYYDPITNTLHVPNLEGTASLALTASYVSASNIDGVVSSASYSETAATASYVDAAGISGSLAAPGNNREILINDAGVIGTTSSFIYNEERAFGIYGTETEPSPISGGFYVNFVDGRLKFCIHTASLYYPTTTPPSYEVAACAITGTYIDAGDSFECYPTGVVIEELVGGSGWDAVEGWTFATTSLGIFAIDDFSEYTSGSISGSTNFTGGLGFGAYWDFSTV